MSIIIGIDPGSRITGYGIIKQQGQQLSCLDYGIISPGHIDFHQKVAKIYQELHQLYQQYQPQQTAIETVFMKNNVQSALKLGQARGAALIVAAQFSNELSEYAPREIKRATVGYGAADKSQIQRMVQLLLKLEDKPTTDAADALAVAICHCHQSSLTDKLKQNRIT